MRLNRLEFALMNNPLRAAIQQHFEAPRLLQMGGPMTGGRALEIGCGRGVGTELILDVFKADRVDAFDLDPRMAALARKRLQPRGSRARVWVGDATAIPVGADIYDAVFDFGIVHHIPQWRKALQEVGRVLKPGGRFYAEELLASLINHPIMKKLLDHPRADRFDAASFSAGLTDAGLLQYKSKHLAGLIAWFTAARADERPNKDSTLTKPSTMELRGPSRGVGLTGEEVAR
jgi:ubiquinone/menaquinone biosynthesis C-methylase UbiE